MSEKVLMTEEDIRRTLARIAHDYADASVALVAITANDAAQYPDDAPAPTADGRFTRLAGRVQAVQSLYEQLTEDSLGDEIDLGSYLSQIATAVMRAHAVEGIHLETKVDSYPVSVNVAMPTGLVVTHPLTGFEVPVWVGNYVLMATATAR